MQQNFYCLTLTLRFRQLPIHNVSYHYFLYGIDVITFPHQISAVKHFIAISVGQCAEQISPYFDSPYKIVDSPQCDMLRRHLWCQYAWFMLKAHGMLRRVICLILSKFRKFYDPSQRQSLFTSRHIQTLEET